MRWRTVIVIATLGLATGCSDANDFTSTTVTGGNGPFGPVVTGDVRVTVNPPSARLAVGTSLQYTTVVRQPDGHEIPNAVLRWVSSDPKVAIVDANGLATGVSVGTVTITVSTFGGAGVAELTVIDPASVSGAQMHGLAWLPELDAGGLAPLSGIWGSSPTDVFAVGASRLWDCCATVMHFDGTAWSYMTVPELFELTDVWGSSGSNVIAVGTGILRYDGVRWSAMPDEGIGSAYLTGVWGTSAADVFAVGSEATVLHFDGQRWTRLMAPIAKSPYWLTDVWGSSASDVFAVGGRGTIIHYDGTGWSRMDTPTDETLQAVWGSSGSNVFAVGHGGIILHYDGTAWRVMSSPTSEEIIDIWGSSPNDVFAVGSKNWYPNCCAPVLHYDGVRWSVVEGPTGQALFGVWGSSPDNVFIVGSGPTILHGRRGGD